MGDREEVVFGGSSLGKVELAAAGTKRGSILGEMISGSSMNG
jgi:hypothetical protein